MGVTLDPLPNNHILHVWTEGNHFLYYTLGLMHFYRIWCLTMPTHNAITCEVVFSQEKILGRSVQINAYNIIPEWYHLEALT